MTYITKEFVVNIAADESDASWILRADEVYTRLTDAVGYSGDLWVESVKVHVRPGISFTGKIPAIKHLRSIVTGLSLIEAKDMIDATTHLGKFRTHGGVVIEYTPDNGNYTISDNR